LQDWAVNTFDEVVQLNQPRSSGFALTTISKESVSQNEELATEEWYIG